MDVAASPTPEPQAKLRQAREWPGATDLPTSRTSVGDLSKLPGPPRPGSAAAKLDLAAVHAAQRFRTPERDALARQLDHDGKFSAWWNMAADYRHDHGLLQGLAGSALLGSTLAVNAAVTGVLKLKHGRPRPFEVDARIKPLFEPKDGSYPSGHASTAFAAARVMSTLDPQLGRDAYRYAAEVAASRVYAGVHFPSDVAAGAAVGTAVADRVLRLFKRD